MKWMEIDKKLSDWGLRVFTGSEFQNVTHVTPVSAKFLLMRYTKRGLLRRLKRDLYAAEGRLPSLWAIANKLYQPSYISLETALSYYGLIPETVYSITSVTTKTTREFDVHGANYYYRSIKHKSFSGYRTVEVEGEIILVAEKTKAMADYLYFIFLKKEKINNRLRLYDVNRSVLLKTLRDFDCPGLLNWFTHDINFPDNRTAR